MRTLLFLYLLICSLITIAQDHPILHAKKEVDIFQRFDNFTTKDGLPSNLILRIFQDNEGFIWFATDNGLSRFDGFNFVNFQPIEGDSTSISNGYVTSITQDRDGYIWVGTKDGLNRLNTKTGKFQRYYKENCNFLSSSWVRALLVCSDGYLWIDCSNGVLAKLDLKSYTPTFYSRIGEIILDSYFQHTIYESKDRRIWAGGVGMPLCVVDKSSNILSVVSDTTINSQTIFNPASCFFEDSQGLMWICNVANKLSINNLEKKIYNQINNFPCIYAISSDKDGSIWFGGYSSTVVKYVPKTNTLTYFKNNPNIPQSFIGKHTFSMLCDRSGVLWFGTDAGVSRLSKHKYKFPLYRHFSDVESPSSNKIVSVFQDSDSDIWFGTDDAALFCTNSAHSTFKKYPYIKDDPNSIGSKTVTAIAQDKQGLFWISLWNGFNGAINSFDKRSGRFRRFKTMDDYYWYRDIEVNSSNEILVGSWGSGVLYFSRVANDYSKVLPFNTKTLPREIGTNGLVTCDKLGRLWYNISIIENYEPLHGRFNVFTPEKMNNKHSTLMLNQVTSKKYKIHNSKDWSENIITDLKGDIWIVYKDVLYYYQNEIDDFKDFRLNYVLNPMSISNRIAQDGFWAGGENQISFFSHKDGLLHRLKQNIDIGNVNIISDLDGKTILISSSTGLFKGELGQKNDSIRISKISAIPFKQICYMDNKSVLLGGDNGLFTLNNDLKTLNRIKSNNDFLVVYSIFKSNKTDIYIGTDNGLLLYRQGDGIVKRWLSNPNVRDMLPSSKVLSITQTPDGNIWMVNGKCTSCFNPKTEKFTNYLEPSNYDLTGPLISVVFTDSKGYLWVGETSGFGLNRVDTKTGYIDHFLNYQWDNTSISKGDVNDIFESKDGTTWVCNESGLNRFVPETKSFIHYDKQTGLGSDNIKAVREDDRGNLWISTSEGITCFNPATLDCQNYSWRDGLQEGDFSTACAAKLKDGRLVFGGMEGYNLFYPDSIKRNEYAPNPIITAIKVNGELQYLSNPSKLNLRFGENNVEISFSCSDFNFPQNNNLEYMLKGYDKTWNKSNQIHTATYTNLPSGSYEFMVKASNNDGVWSKEPLVLHIRVGYPLWLRWWAIIIELLFLFGAISLVVKFRLRKVNTQKSILENEVSKRTEELLMQKEEISAQRDVLNKQKDHIYKIHNQLSDSIEYASYLQEAFNISEEQRNSILGENFLINLPKEKLGGDFFWATSIDDSIIFVVADCTGHGVPGALMSMVGLTLIKNLALSPIGLQPNLVLDAMHAKLLSTLSEPKKDSSMLNAMDIAYCTYSKKHRILKYSGAHISIYISNLKDGKRKIDVIKCDKKGVGNVLQTGEFSTNEIYLDEDSYIYAFTDGLADQLSSEKKEKFTKNEVLKLLERIADYQTQNQKDLILSTIYEWKGQNDQTDDIMVLGIRF